MQGALEMTHPDGIPAPFSTKASSKAQHEAYGENFFVEATKYNPHSPYLASNASSDHFVRAFHDTYGMPTIVTNLRPISVPGEADTALNQQHPPSQATASLW